MVMIGDAIPHTVADYKNIMRSYTFVKEAVDWRKEADELVGMVSDVCLSVFIHKQSRVFVTLDMVRGEGEANCYYF